MLTLARKNRAIVKPHNDLLLSFDYNGAEVRTFLELANQEQPEGDIHQWNIENIFESNLTRDEAKTIFFAWLYNPDSTEIKCEMYNREKILDKYIKCGYNYYYILENFMNEWDRSPVLDETVETSNELKSFLVNYVGNKTNPENNDVTVDHIVKVMSEDFPEFLLAVAEENFIRGYKQALDDADSARDLLEQEKNSLENESQ